jgi:hypothetical protein
MQVSRLFHHGDIFTNYQSINAWWYMPQMQQQSKTMIHVSKEKKENATANQVAANIRTPSDAWAPKLPKTTLTAPVKAVYIAVTSAEAMSMKANPIWKSLVFPTC